jgi:phosphate-selective porin OprO/OprP
MKHVKRTAIASVINLALFGLPAAHAADTEALERRIRELEARLEKLDHTATQTDKAATASPEVEKLTRKVNTLERKLEVQDEVTASNFKKLPVFDAGPDGFKISSSDKKHQVRIRGAVQADARFFSEDGSHRSIDSFDLKQARVWLEGYVFNNIYYKIMPDFAASGNILPDAYIDYAYDPAINLLVGKFKPSLSLERLQGDSDGTFLERAFPTYLASNRDVGIQVHGAFAKPGYTAETVPGPIDSKNFFTYQLGVGNGSGDDGSPNNNGGATYDSKEFVGRIFAHPFQHTNTLFDGFGIGLAGSLDDPNKQALRTQATPLGRTTYLNYANTYRGTVGTTTNTAFAAPTADGDRHRIYPQAYWYTGPLGLIGEYVVSTQHLSGTARGLINPAGTGRSINVEQNNKAWQVLASYVLTGEDNSFGAIKPIQNFSPLDGKWGALQIAARWSEISIDKSTFLLLDPSQSASRATAWTVGLNWFLNSYALIRADYEQVSFTGGAGTIAKVADRPTEHVFGTRFQLAFKYVFKDFFR